MKITLLGTGGAWHDAKRSAATTLVEVGDKKFLFDCGPGVSRQICKVGVPLQSVNHIFFTHLHIDHCCELPALIFGTMLIGDAVKYSLFGPVGTKDFVNSVFGHTYPFASDMMFALRKNHIQYEVFEKDSGIVFEEDGIKVECVRVEHDSFVTAISYKVSYGDKSVVITGDLAYCESIVNFAEKADALIIDCGFPHEQGKRKLHCSEVDIANIAEKAGVKKLISTHMFPPWNGREKDIITNGKEIFSGEIIVGEDLLEVNL